MSEQEQGRKPSPFGTVGVAVLLVAVLVVAVYGLAHASIRPINPEQKPPEGHFAAPCPLCHTMSASARLTQP